MLLIFVTEFSVVSQNCLSGKLRPSSKILIRGMAYLCQILDLDKVDISTEVLSL
jgi:hypothetical protein